MPDITSDQRREITALRSLIDPGNVQLSSFDGRRWLTDNVVLLDVTGFSVAAGLPDGWYRINAGGKNPGFNKRSESPPLFSVEAYITGRRQLGWYPVRPTAWSITDHGAKAFLLYAEVPLAVKYRSWRRIPVAMNADVWTAFLATWPDAELRHSGHGRPFLVSTPGIPELAYVESIVIPEERQAEAIAIVEAYSWPSPEDGDEPEQGGGRDGEREDDRT